MNHPFFGHHMHEFLFQAGQPREVWQNFCAAMGIDPGHSTGAPPPASRFGVMTMQAAEAEA
jgi:5,5'-dehydrodivanillate O-demethylase